MPCRSVEVRIGVDVQLMLYLVLLACFSGFVYLDATADLSLERIRDSPVPQSRKQQRNAV